MMRNDFLFRLCMVLDNFLRFRERGGSHRNCLRFGLRDVDDFWLHGWRRRSYCDLRFGDMDDFRFQRSDGHRLRLRFRNGGGRHNDCEDFGSNGSLDQGSVDNRRCSNSFHSEGITMLAFVDGGRYLSAAFGTDPVEHKSNVHGNGLYALQGHTLWDLPRNLKPDRDSISG
jgi:hypothetical protein